MLIKLISGCMKSSEQSRPTSLLQHLCCTGPALHPWWRARPPLPGARWGARGVGLLAAQVPIVCPSGAPEATATGRRVWLISTCQGGLQPILLPLPLSLCNSGILCNVLCFHLFSFFKWISTQESMVFRLALLSRTSPSYWFAYVCTTCIFQN